MIQAICLQMSKLKQLCNTERILLCCQMHQKGVLGIEGLSEYTVVSDLAVGKMLPWY